MARNETQSDMVAHPVFAVASAATCDIGATITDRVSITGTTTITSFGTKTNKLRFVTFAAALVLTHNATSLILPTGANITTVAGDSAILSSDASGYWTCLVYQRKNGTALVAGDYSVNPLASAATTDLASIASSRVSITGTTTITSLGAGTNVLKFVTFAAALVLTHNATSLILPTAENITTAAGDSAIFSSDGSGNWTCLHYQRKNGKPVYGNTAFLDVEQVWTQTQTSSPQALTHNTAWNGYAIQNATVAVNGSNFTIANPSQARTGAVYLFTVDYTTSHALSFGANFKGISAVTPSNTAGQADSFAFRYDGTYMRLLGYQLNNKA